MKRLLSAAVLSLFAVTASPFASQAASPAKTAMLQRINEARAQKGLGPLAPHWDLEDDAQKHSRRMAQENRIFHVPDLRSVTENWVALGAYEGAGPSTDAVHTSMMSSGVHRDQVFGDYHRVGIGVALGPGGLQFVSLVFMREAR